MGNMELNLEELAMEDYNAARANLIEAEKEGGKIKSTEEVISEANKKLEFFDVHWLIYQEDKNNKDSLRECAKIAREVRFLSTNALDKAKSVDLSLGIKVVKTLFFMVFAFLILYIVWHKDIPWYKGNFWLEILIFGLFGVLTNLTYSAAKHVLDKDFDKWQIGWYWSKIVQAPFIALSVILFLRNAQVSVLQVSINFQEASPEIMVAVAYVMGFFSRRTWEYLEKIKDWLMPPPKSEEGARNK